MLIMGETGSGKSYFLKKKILPSIKSKYDSVVIFTRDYNKLLYEKYIEDELNMKGVVLTFDKKFLITAIDKIKQMQSVNIKEYDKEKHPIYNNSIILVFDDILDEKIMRQDDFLELFINMRHMQFSIILLSQITNKAITTQMKANTQFNVMFNLGGYYQQQYPVQLITEAVLKKHPEMKHDNAKNEAHKIYQAKCVEKKYGYIIIDNEMNKYIP